MARKSKKFDIVGWWKGKKRPEEWKKSRSEEKSVHWKGEKAKYRAKHNWIEKRMGKPDVCDKCGNCELKHRQYHWANISGKYKREIGDWARLCVKCHFKLDFRRREKLREKYRARKLTRNSKIK